MIKIKCKTEDTLQLSELTEFQGNLKARDDADFEKIERSIKKHGFSFPFFVWKKGKINYCLDGHGRIGALQRMVASGEKLPPLPVVYVSCKDEADAKELLLKLNSQYGHMTAESVREFLGDLQIDLADLALPEGILDLSLNTEDQETKGDDETPEVDYEAEPDSKPGMVYELGPHRLIVGDSTKAEDIEKLMAGEKADLIVTDPPYNVDYEGSDGKKIKNDHMEDTSFLNFLISAFTAMFRVLKNGGVYYIWHADIEGYNFRSAVKQSGGIVRQCIIWVKNSLVLGRQDYQWRHEPCQPAGTKVLTTEGEKNIEDLKDGDRVISFDTYAGAVKGYKNGGYEIKTTSRDYKGYMYKIHVGNKATQATDNHQFTVRFNPKTGAKYCTYLMRRGKWWRVGITRTYDARGFGLKHRYEQEKAEEAWLIDTFETMADAQMAEQMLACRYGIPYTHWETERGIKDNPYNTRSQKQIEWLYDNLDIEKLQEDAKRLLHDFGRSIKYPLVNKENKRQKYSRRVTARIEACNLIPGLMEVPVPKAPADAPNFEWAEINSISYTGFDGKVYSLAVEKLEHYIADGIITHNCLYGWKEGRGHYWEGRRDLSTVFDETRSDWKKMNKDELIAELKRVDNEIKTSIIYEDKPARNAEHPTMKPVRLFERLIKNSSKEEDIVLDPFGGSGTTIIACAKTNRVARVVEFDPKYADVIRKRWTTWAQENHKEVGSGKLQ